MYVLLTVIRFFLFGAFYPITARLGLGTNWQETVFQSWGGLRGAVGIALALFIHNKTLQAHEQGGDPIFLQQIDLLFAFVGGEAFLTLMINATTAGPMLRALGLADSGEIREKILSAIKIRWRADMIDQLVALMTQRRFRQVNFGVIREHVHALHSLTEGELVQASACYHEKNCHDPSYHPPYLKDILPHLEQVEESCELQRDKNSVTNCMPKEILEAMMDDCRSPRRFKVSVLRRSGDGQSRRGIHPRRRSRFVASFSKSCVRRMKSKFEPESLRIANCLSTFCCNRLTWQPMMCSKENP